MEYRREVDGLRAVAIIPVLLFHAGFSWVKGGYVGVDVFFVISGYLITSLILAEKRAGRFSIINFYERRARRILPALFLIMFACLIPAWVWMTPQALKNFGQSLAAVSVFANNVLLGYTSGYFEPAVDEKPLLHTWSLAVEEQYYVFFPLLLLLLGRLSRRWLIGTVCAAALLSLGAAEWGWRNQPEAGFYLVQNRAWELLLGVLVAFALEEGGIGRPRNPIVCNVLAVFGLLLIAVGLFAFDDHTPFPSIYGLVPTVGTALVLYTAHRGNLIGKLLAHPVFVGVGLISYSLYLWHQPLLAFARVVSNFEPSAAVRAALLGLTVILAYISWRFVEMPLRNRALFTRRTVFAAALVCSVLFVTVGLTAALSGGFIQRMPPGYAAEIRHFEQQTAERKKWLQSSCYFSESAIRQVPVIADRWKCHTEPAPAHVLVIGDSHAADKAMALRLNGLVVDEMTGPDCSLAPSRMLRFCRERFDALLDSNIQKKYDLVLLARRWRDVAEVAAFERQIAYWKRDGEANIVLCGPMPEFGKFADRMAYLVGTGESRDAAARRAQLDSHALENISTAVAAAARRNGLGYFDTAAAFCRLSQLPGCVPAADQQFLLIDYAHLSEHGAQLLGRSLVQNLGLQALQTPAVGNRGAPP